MLSLSFFASMNACLWLEEHVEFNIFDITFLMEFRNCSSSTDRQ
jgi:hypothetical protein